MDIKYRHRSGRCIEYLDAEGKWKSTGQKDRQKAEMVARAMYLGDPNGGRHRFGKIADAMVNYKGEGSWYELMRKTKQISEVTFRNFRYNIRYSIPYFEDAYVEDIMPMMVQSWYLGLKTIHGDPISVNTANNALSALSNVMKYCQLQGFITYNPCHNIVRMKSDEKGHPAFTDDEIEKLCPKDRKSLLELYGSINNALYFMLMRYTGFRPNEVLGLTADCYFPKYHAIYTKQSYDYATKWLKEDVKTTRKGKDWRFAIIPGFVEEMLKEEIARVVDKPIFINEAGFIKSPVKMQMRFNKVLARAGIEKNDRTQYSFRSTFFTNTLKDHPDEIALELLGDQNYHRCYDQRTPEDVIRRMVAKIRSTYIKLGGEEDLDAVIGE